MLAGHTRDISHPMDEGDMVACPCVPETSFTRSKREGGFTLLITK